MVSFFTLICAKKFHKYTHIYRRRKRTKKDKKAKVYSSGWANTTEKNMEGEFMPLKMLIYCYEFN